MVSTANRRLSARFTCQLAVSYKTGAEWHPATGMDLSGSGCRVRLGEDLPRGAKLKVRFDRPAAEGAALHAELDGTVIWSRLEGLSFQAGVQFDEGEQEDVGLNRILATLGASAPSPS